MITPISFFVSGEPKGQPRPRAFARNFGGKWQARMYDAGTAEAWKQQIAVEWERAKPIGFNQFLVAVSLSIIFAIKRPKAHYNRKGIRPDAPHYCQKKPDADNFAKAVMDALTVIGVWADDSQVCDLRAVKIFTDSNLPGAQITIKELDEKV